LRNLLVWRSGFEIFLRGRVFFNFFTGFYLKIS
jgi:hypothetical protein